ncbi:P-type conjugative transfer protein VirB9 [Phyllobacterium sp. P30BS-XVII]|uniref:P-type conjugative transfer protein VirB9 n=1 Tax=Phyllobacterium sp. P30BS-XVII TaxID=2587046 RepID=UPI0015FA9CE4|nr:P-type conjugative transfer protein VirB9 [Phyllobacterium sp. P30BS-XVII]MBA8904143.1 type IV secretion system protein VirB9 [Phyllobacterium sp. P30BS-XVII]
MRVRTGLLLGVALTVLVQTSGLAFAESTPKSVKADERIRTVTYQKDNIIFLSGMMGVSTMVVFNDDEQIATVAMGDSQSWQAVPDQSKKFLFIKPLEPNAVTNMNVVTSKRVYNFMMKGSPVGNSRTAVIKLRFSYPDDEADARLMAQAKINAAMPNVRAALSDPMKVNYDYGYKGDRENKPTSVADDGTKTFFEFTGEVPGIFAVKSDGSETLVNYRREGNYIVVDKVNRQWTLRSGKIATCVFNMKLSGGRAIAASSVGGRAYDR